MPIGKRPVPRVAGPRPRAGGKSGANYGGVRSSGSPTGSRPVPKVASNTARAQSKAPGNRKATRVTPMPSPKQAQAKRPTPKTY